MIDFIYRHWFAVRTKRAVIQCELCAPNCATKQPFLKCAKRNITPKTKLVISSHERKMQHQMQHFKCNKATKQQAKLLQITTFRTSQNQTFC
jgi:hypothetical protein